MSVFSRLMRPSGKAPRNTADAMNNTAWITESLKDSRARALAALLRYFRDLDTAEDALQEACVQAIRVWPVDGAPRDPVAWLVLVGRNAGIDELRRRARNEPLPAEDLMSDTDDAGPALIDRLERLRYRDDVLRLMFVCCHPALSLTQQVALALRVVSGLSLAELASAFLVSEDAMEQRITRAKRRIGELRVPFEAPGRIETGRRLSAVLSTLYLVFNEGYAASGGEQHLRPALCEEAIRLVRLLHQLFGDDAEVGGLVALMLLQHARAAARLDAAGDIVLLEAQDRTRWDPCPDRTGPGLPARRAGPAGVRALPVAGRHCRHARTRAVRGAHRLGGDRSALCRAGSAAAFAGGDAEPGGGGVEAARACCGAAPGRSTDAEPGRVLPFSRLARRAAARAGPPLKKRGPRSTARWRWPAHPPRGGTSMPAWTPCAAGNLIATEEREEAFRCCIRS
jgi:RNA polymerase sigma-70 factor (ECF subfamily)